MCFGATYDESGTNIVRHFEGIIAKYFQVDGQISRSKMADTFWKYDGCGTICGYYGSNLAHMTAFELGNQYENMATTRFYNEPNVVENPDNAPLQHFEEEYLLAPGAWKPTAIPGTVLGNTQKILAHTQHLSPGRHISIEFWAHGMVWGNPVWTLY